MLGRIYCIDNDILKKLATFDLFDETIQLFQASPNEINILPTAKHKFRRDLKKAQQGQHRKPEDKVVNYEKTVELAEKLSLIIDTDINQELFIQLSQINGVDQGEALLTAYVAFLLQKYQPIQAVILTGDKNYLRALSQVQIPLIQENFAHRFWCLEQLVWLNIQKNGFDFVRDKIVPVRDCDKAMKAVFGSGQLSTQENSLATLKSYITTLREETGNLFNPYPN